MADDPNVIPPRRLVGWAAIGVLVVLAVALYFVHGRTLPPLTAEPSTDTPALR
jgi:hypothetical protein